MKGNFPYILNMIQQHRKSKCVCVREREREKENYGKRNDQIEDCSDVAIVPRYICYAEMLRRPRQ